MGLGWLLTLPSAAAFGAAAAAIALTGTPGVVVVLVALVAGSLGILALSRRSPVNRHNVTDDATVTVELRRTPPVPDRQFDDPPIVDRIA